jgi:VanZ family protein
MNKIIFAVWVACIVGVAIGSVSPSMAPPGVYNLDKVAHFVGYFVLAFLPSLLIKKMWQQALLCVCVILMGAGLEIAQSHVPGREGSLDDLFANALGALSGVVASLNLSHKKRHSRKRRSKA